MKSTGFTIVELVLTLVLVGIVAAIGIGRLTSRDSYEVKAVADQILAHAHLAQRVALGRHAFSSGVPVNTTLSLNRSGNQVLSSVSQANYQPEQAELDARTVTVRVKTSGTNVCGGGQTLSSGSFALTYDQAGDTGSNTLICVAGNYTVPICITRLGYAYEGECEF